MKTRLWKRTAIALAVLMTPILNGCGANTPPPAAGGAVGPGAPVCVPAGAAQAPMPIPFTVTQGMFTRTALRFTAGKIPQAVFNLAGIQAGQAYGQVVLGSAAPVAAAPVPGAAPGTAVSGQPNLTGVDRVYGSTFQMNAQPGTQQVDLWGLPLGDAPMTGTGVLTLAPQAVLQLQQLSQMLSGQNTSFIGQPGYFPMQQGVVPVPTVAAGAQVCVSEISFSADIIPSNMYKGLPTFSIGDVWVFLGNGPTNTGHGIHVKL